MKYTNQKCQICNAKLLEGDDVVICPECGAPYHRECYKSSGHCAYEDKHAEGFEFKLEKVKGEKSGDKICTRCGSENPTDATNCQICGYPTLQNKKEGREYHKKVDSLDDDNGNFPFKNINFPGGPKIHIIGANYDSLGGVPKDSKIDGESAADVATVIGQNTAYYMPRFKEMSERNKKASWNWTAFIIPQFWFFLRKCYLQGIAALLINIALQLVVNFAGNRVIELIGASFTETLTSADLMRLLDVAMQDPELAPKLMYLSMISFIATLILAGVNVVWGIFANYIYKQKVIDTVRAKNKEANQENLSNNERIMLLGSSGGTNLFLGLLFLFLSFEFVAFISQIIMYL